MDKTTLFEGVKGIIFDLDGTLMDSMGVWLDIDDKFFKSHGMECPSDYQKSISHKSTMEGAIYTKEKYHLSETPEELCTLWKNMALAQYSKDIKMKPYALDILKEFKSRGYKIALATSTESYLYEPCLKNNHIRQYFDVCVNANDLKTNKSEPKIYLEAAKEIGLKPSEIIVFEDILIAVKTAKKAGFKVVGVQDDASEKDRDEIKKTADLYITSFRKLL